MNAAYILIVTIALVSASAAQAGGPQSGPRETSFDAQTAWQSFERLIRDWYAHIDREEVDAERIIAHFRPLATAAQTDDEFIDILQLVSHNFADPHFIVGPFDDEDWAIVPTFPDIYAEEIEGEFRINQVRENSAAYEPGVRRGRRIVVLDGRTTNEAIATVTGRLLDDLSPIQRTFALNVALAGLRGQPRSLTLTDSGFSRTYELAPTNEKAREVSEGRLLWIERNGPLAVIRIYNSLGDNALIRAFADAMKSVADEPQLLIDLRNTPSGGNTTVARGILGHFVDRDQPYQLHTIPWESRVFGPQRKFLEYVSPYDERYRGEVYVAGGRWTGSMGEGLMIGFEAIGATTIGTELADLLGALSNRTIDGSAARIDLGTEALFAVDGEPREDFRPQIALDNAERNGGVDPVIAYLLQ